MSLEPRQGISPTAASLGPAPRPAVLSRRRFLKYSVLGFLGLLGCSAIWYQRRWDAIIVHHSAGDFGNVAFLDKVHRQRQPYDPINSMAYHFVIGNGHGMPLGSVAYGLRWKNRLWGAHVSPGNARFNIQGIGICLVGNYHEKSIPAAQYDALIDLVRKLTAAHGIRIGNIYPHCRLDGERTVCPGKFFPYERFYLDIA